MNSLEKAEPRLPKAYLVAEPGASYTRPIMVESRQTFIGRFSEDDNHIKVDDRHISRKHACIHFDGRQFLIEDLSSRNGTFLNKRRIDKVPLNNHDRISIGRHNYLFLIQPSPAVASAAEHPSDASSNVAVSHTEMDLSDIWAQKAENAARGFLHPSMTETAAPDTVAHRRLSLLYQLSERLSAAGDTEEVYAKSIELVTEAIPEAEFALVARKPEFQDGFSIAAIQFGNRQQADGQAVPLSQTVFDWVFKEKVALVSQNLGTDRRFQGSESIQIHDLRSIVCVPIAGKKEVFGLLYAQANNLLSPFTRDDAEFISAVANEMALNIDNLRLQRHMLRNARMAAIGLTVSNLAHNIKNLLSVNQTAIQLMDMHVREKDYTHIEKKWHWIKDSLEGISKLSNDMLAYAREDQLGMKPIDVNAVVLSSRKIFEDSTSRADLHIEYALTPDNPTWPLDEDQLKQSLLNLVLNAADALKEKNAGRILISTAVHQDGQLHISVKDDGCGIPEKNRRKVLDLFFTTKGSKGTGLGLPMAHKFVEKSGGELRFQSEEGKGSVFTMAFPPQDF